MQSMNSSRAFEASRGPQSFSYLTPGRQTKEEEEKKKKQKNLHKHTNLSHLSCLPSRAWCGVTAAPTFLSLHPVYEIEFQSSLPFLTRKGPNGFHLLWLRGAGTAGATAALFAQITEDPSVEHMPGPPPPAAPALGVNFQAINLGGHHF